MLKFQSGGSNICTRYVSYYGTYQLFLASFPSPTPFFVLHTIAVSRPSPFFAALLLLCIILNANQRTKNGGGLGTRQRDSHITVSCLYNYTKPNQIPDLIMPKAIPSKNEYRFIISQKQYKRFCLIYYQFPKVSSLEGQKHVQSEVNI